MTDDAVRWAVETDRQYHFLTTAQLAHIQTLQRQGKEQEAAAEATRIFADVAGERLQRVYASLNPLESGWKSLTDTIKNSWQTLKDSFSDDPEKLRARLQWFIDQRTQLLAQGGKADASLLANDVYIQQWRQQQAALDRLIDKERQAARVEGERQEAEDRAKRALLNIDNQRIQWQTKAEQKQSALNRLAQDYIDLWNAGRGKDSPALQGVSFANGQPAGGSYAIARQRIEEKYTDQPARDEESAYARLNRQITERIAALNAANASETRLTETQQFSEKMLATLADGTNRLTQAQQANLRARLRDLAGVDRASQEKADAKTLGDIQTQYLRAIGDNAALASAEIEQKWGDLIRRLNARGDQDGRALIQKLLNAEQAQRQVEAIQRRIQDVLAEQSRGEQSVQIQRQAGLISEINARQQLVELNRRTAEQLQLIRPDLEALQSAPGDIGRKAGAALAALDTQTQQLRVTTGLLSETLRKGFEEGLASALQGLADGTKSLQDAVRGLVQSVAGAMAQLAAQNLAQQATEGLSQLLGATGNDPSQTAATATNTAAQTANTTAVAANTTAQATAATALGTTATAAGATTTAMAAATQAGAALSLALQAAAVAAAGNSTADTVGTVAKVAAAASGGLIRGPGSGTSDSIPAWLSNNEFVLRAAVVQQPGALDFLRAFNLRGMAALRFADGGPVGLPRISAPRTARFELAEPAAAMGGPGNVTVRQRLLPVLDDDLIADALRGPKGEELITLHISRNPSKFRSLLGK